MLTSEAVAEFLASRSGLRPRTQGEYRRRLALFERAFPVLPETSPPVQSWINSFKNLTPETVHTRFATIRVFYRQLHLWHPDVPDPMPLVRGPRVPPKPMRTFSDQELYRLFSLLLSPRDRALITLFLDSGPRAGECANLTSEGILPGYAVLRGKTGARIVPISDITYRLLDALRPKLPPDGHHHLFVGERGPLTYQGIYKTIRRLCKQAGITGRRASPISFRHTFGTEYAAMDEMDPKVLQEILGHKQFATTLRYIQNNPRRMSHNHARCTPLKGLAVAAQGSLFREDLVNEAEAIVAREVKR